MCRLLLTLTSLYFIICGIKGGNKSVVQKTVEALFFDRTNVVYPGACKIFNATSRQLKICRKDPGLQIILANAKLQAIEACEQNFLYDRWNCSVVFNKKPNKSIFNKVYRETAFIHALLAASVTHAVAKGCASGDLYRCSCLRNVRKNNTTDWIGFGCGDDFKYGKRLVKNFFELKRLSSDQVTDILKHDALIGIDSIGKHLKEVCKCHGFSGSCTTKTCWKRLGPFNSAVGLLKKHYHHAVRKKVKAKPDKMNASGPKKRVEYENNKLIYAQRTPNLCVSTKGRLCKDRNNCATLCCGRGYTASKKSVTIKCRCKMETCCLVTCDTCNEDVDIFTCK